jgi:hypothetical protein
MNPSHTLSLSLGSSPGELARTVADVLTPLTWMKTFRQSVRPDGDRCRVQTN